jgi:hypothetical protein
MWTLYYTFDVCMYVWKLDPRHTYDEHSILSLKSGVTEVVSELGW